MNIEAYNKIIDIIEPLLLKKEMTVVDKSGESYYANGNTAIKVVFNDTNKTFNLMESNVENGEPNGKWSTLSQWIFLEDYTLSDAESIGNDFYDTLNAKLGLKKTVTRSNDIKIDGDARASMSLEGLVQNFITKFPQYKETYKEHVGKYGQCLYIDFLEQTAVPCLKEELTAKNKKHLKKFFELLNEYYCFGDRNTASVISAVIIKGAVNGDAALEETAMSYMEEYKYLKNDYNYIKICSK